VINSQGERQDATTLHGVAPDHLSRYQWAVDQLRKLLPPRARVLDAACGSGYGSMLLAQAGFQVTGVDRSEKAQNLSLNFLSGYLWVFRQMDLMDIVGPFDAVVSIETIEHIPEDRAWVQRIGELAPLVLATVPNEDVNPFSPETNKWHFRHYSPAELEDLFQGWEINERWTQHGTKWQNTQMVPGFNGRVIGLIGSLPGRK